MTDEDRDAERWDAAQEGMELLREGEVDRAIDELEGLVLREPDNAYGYYFLGGAHFEKGNLDKAMKAYVLALEKAPRYVGAMVSLGHTLRLLGRYDQALRMGNQVLAINKQDADALYLMGLTHYARGEEAAARSYLVRFLETQPEVEVAQEAQGLLEIIEGRAQPLEEG